MQFEGVSLSYQTKKSNFTSGIHHVLKDVSLTLNHGETLGIIGKNGVGKSSILRLMAGIIDPSAGKISRLPGSKTALLTLGLGFMPNLSGRDNAMLAAMLQGALRHQAESYLSEIKDFSELGDSFEEPVKTYSSGMRARLAFTTAMITHVDVLLIDEILSVGDAQFKEKAGKAMRNRMDGDQTVVLVSHNDIQIEQLCDRAIWISEGKISSEGETSSVVESYRKSLSVT